jgi:hypothetical protein
MSIPAGRSIYYKTFAATPEAREVGKKAVESYNKSAVAANEIISFMRQGGDFYNYDFESHQFVSREGRSSEQMKLDFYTNRLTPFNREKEKAIVADFRAARLKQSFLYPGINLSLVQMFEKVGMAPPDQEKLDLLAFLEYKIGQAPISFKTAKLEHLFEKTAAGTFKSEGQKKGARLRQQVEKLESRLVEDKKRLKTIDPTHNFEEFQWRLSAVQIPSGLAADIPARLEVLKKLVTELQNGTFSLDAYLDVITWDGFVKGFLDSSSYFLGLDMLQFKMEIVNMAADSNRSMNRVILSSQQPTEQKIAALRAEIESLEKS